MNRVLRKASSKRFCFIRCSRQHLQAIEKRKCSKFTFVENTVSNSPKLPRATFPGGDGLFWFSNICKSDKINNPFARVTILSEIYFRFRKFILLRQ